MSPRIALVAPSIKIVGGQMIQAQALLTHLRSEGWPVDFLGIDPAFPWGLGWIRRLPYARTALNQALYIPGLLRLRQADVVQVVHPWLRLAHEIVVPSEYLREVFARHGYRSRVIPNVVNTSDFRYRERRPARPHLVSTRNLERHYRVDNTLEAFALIQARYPQAILSVAGYGREETRLRELATSLKLAGVRFLGRVAPAELPALLDQADVFVNSSIVDNQPVSVLEAFAAGLPVVSTPTGDIANMIRDGETGLLVPPGDPAAMAKAVISLLENPNRARELARRAHAELEKYTWAHVSKRWAQAYIGSPA